MKPNLHGETADRAAEERSEDDGMPEHWAEAGDPAGWAAERLERTGRRAPAAQRGSGRTGMVVLAFGLGLLSLGLLSGGPVRDAAAQQQRERETQERETQEEVAACRVVTGETGAPAGRTTMGVCARAIQAGSGAGTWGPYEFEVDRGGRVHVNGEYVGVMRWTDLPTIDSPGSSGRR